MGFEQSNSTKFLIPYFSLKAATSFAGTLLLVVVALLFAGFWTLTLLLATSVTVKPFKRLA